MSEAEGFGALILEVATHFWGAPTSTKKGESRWGKQGSKSVSIAKGTWHDHESKTGGGVLDLVMREVGGSKAEAVDYLKEKGFAVPDDGRKPERAERPKAGKSSKRADGSWWPVDDNFNPTAFYDYTDAKGKVVFQVVRFEAEGEPKTFRQRRRAGKDWEWGLKGVEPIPYRLPELIEDIASGSPIFIVEGEKDVDNLRAEGIAATCNPMGAGKWPESFAQWFKGAKRITILPDNDDAGRAHANLVGANLKGIAETYVLDLPALDDKGDVSDWLDAGGSADALFALAKDARAWSAAIPATTFGAIRFEDLDKPGEELEYIIDDWWTCSSVSVTAGATKAGKSFLATHAGMIVALHATTAYAEIVPDFFGQKVLNPGLVVYFAGEGARGVKNRLRAFRKHFNVPHSARVPFVLLQKRLDLLRGSQDGKLSDTDRLIAECKAWQAYYEIPLAMVIVDTLATASAGADENSNKDMSTVLANCERIKDQTGAHVMLVHHMNAAGGRIRGHSSISANMDQVVLVTRDETTRVRTVVLDKQKDGEEGKLIRFALPQIKLGSHPKTGKEITSCVVVEPEDKEIEESNTPIVEAKNSAKASAGEKLYLQAFNRAIRKHGVSTADKPEIDATIAYCVEQDHVREFFDKAFFTGEKEKSKAQAARRQAAKRAVTGLLNAGILKFSDDFLWWTGRPVKGVRWTQVQAQLSHASREDAPLPSDIDDFMGGRA